MHPTSIHITAVLVKWNTSTGRVQKGVATNWLAEKNSKGTVYILFNKNNQTLNVNLELHCIIWWCVAQPNFSVQTLTSDLRCFWLVHCLFIVHCLHKSFRILAWSTLTTAYIYGKHISFVSIFSLANPAKRKILNWWCCYSEICGVFCFVCHAV